MAFGDTPPTTGGTAWTNLPMVAPGPGFNALLGRVYDEMGNVQARNATAFQFYEQKKGREADQYQREVERMAWERRQREAEVQRQKDLENRARQDAIRAQGQGDAAQLAERQKRMDVIGTMNLRDQNLAGWPSSTPMTGNIIDAAMYGPDAPGGRGGGGNAQDSLDLQQVWQAKQDKERQAGIGDRSKYFTIG